MSLEVEKDQRYRTANLSGQHQAFVTAAIFHGVAFAETAINEVFGDAGESQKHGVVADLPADVKTGLANIPEGCLRLMALHEKLKAALDIAKKGVDFGQQPYQDAVLAVKLRNALVHYRPEGVTVVDTANPSNVTRHPLESVLRHRFAPNPWFAGGPFLPTLCLSHGCAEWAVNSMLWVMDEFYRLMGMQPPYTLSRERRRLATR